MTTEEAAQYLGYGSVEHLEKNDISDRSEWWELIKKLTSKDETELNLHFVMLCYVDTYSANGYPTFKKGKFYPIEKSYLKGLLIMRNEQGIITKMSGEYWETIKDNFNKA